MGNDLTQKLEVICSVFDIEHVLSLKTDKSYIQKYYSVNKIPYSIFHTKTDLIHMGVSRDGVLKESDLLDAARTVEEYIKRFQADSVLELATGRGANSTWLSDRNPDVVFHGIDLSEVQLNFAKKKAVKRSNYNPIKGDYHDLSEFRDQQFNIVFVVEALCYSTNKAKVLDEAYRVLKPGGVFIVFDGYAKKKSIESEEEKLAMQLTEKGMALEKSESYEQFRKIINSSKFSIESEEDVSNFVLPTMEKFEKLACRFFDRGFTAKIIANVLPDEFCFNAISGYLMPTLMKDGLASYWITILKK